MKFNNIRNFKFFVKALLFISGLSSFGIILIASVLNIYSERSKVAQVIGYKKEHSHGERYLVNPLKKSTRQLPKYNLEELKIESNADKIGQWSAPIDWNVTSIHSVLLPDYSVMTFGTFGIVGKDNKDFKENKNITLNNGTVLKRDDGKHQWVGHHVNQASYFDIWDFKLGFNEDSHEVFIDPIVMDAFCTVVRVLDEKKVLLVGGGKNEETGGPDTQAQTMIYNIEDRTFEQSSDLNYKRWYGSLVRTGDDKLIIIGGRDKISLIPSHIPEILDLNNFENGWKILEKAGSKNLFGETEPENMDYGVSSSEWWYPRSYLASDGNIVGISYNKIWMMDKDDDYRVRQTNEIKLETGGISGIIEDPDLNLEIKNHNHKRNKHIDKLRVLTIGSPVGASNSTVMIDKDLVMVFGGKQSGAEYSPSNKALKIDFSDSSNPKISKINSMLKPRANADATILPNGEIFINGGHSLEDLKFSIFSPEIYDPINEKSTLMSKAYFRRNYHSSSLLLPNGTILVSGGDVWNSEIFYPPYLFTKNWEGKTILEKRPLIDKIEKTIERGNITLKLDENFPLDIGKFTLISTGSVTHAQGSEPKFRSLKFKKTKINEFIIEIPDNKNELQNGSYMIFAIRKNGTPSEGAIINLI